MPNQSYHHGDLKAELIRTGLQLLDQEGYEGFSLRKVAKACNVSQTAPYRHFKDKDELISAITAEALRAFNESLEQAVLQNSNNPKKQLTEMGVAYIQFFVENPAYLRLLFLSNIKGNMDKLYCSNQEPADSSDAFQTFYQSLERFISAYPNQTMNKQELLLYSWGLVHGIAVLIANKDVPFTGDYLTLSRNIISNGFYTMDSLAANPSNSK